MYKIVIVEDELIAAEYLKQILHKGNFRVLDIIDNGLEALSRIPQLKPDIVLMDIMLKDHISGSEVALSLKYTAPEIAIMFLTAYAESEMIDYAVQSNTYGYLMKPYDEHSILNSLKIILARLEETNHNKILEQTHLYIKGSLYFDRKRNRLFNSNKEVSLGVKSLLIMEALCKQPNITISATELCINVWGEPKSSSMLRTQISRLKKEIGEDIIENVKGLGYKIICN